VPSEPIDNNVVAPNSEPVPPPPPPSHNHFDTGDLLVKLLCPNISLVNVILGLF